MKNGNDSEKGADYDPLNEFFDGMQSCLIHEDEVSDEESGETDTAHQRRDTVNFINNFKFSPLATCREEDDVFSIVDELPSSNIEAEKIIERDEQYDVLPIAPLCGFNLLFTEAAYKITLEDYWKAMVPRIKEKLLVRGNLKEHVDYEICDRGILQFLVLLKEPTKAVKNMLYPDGMAYFTEWLKSICYSDSMQTFYVLPLPVSDDVDAPAVEDVGDYDSISVEPVLVDVSYIRSRWFNEELSMEERKGFLDEYSLGLYNALALEHRVVSYEPSLSDYILSKICHSATMNNTEIGDYDVVDEEMPPFNFVKRDEGEDDDSDEGGDDLGGFDKRGRKVPN